MAKKTYTVKVEEIIRYQIEVEATSAKQAATIAEAEFFGTSPDDRSHKWMYIVYTNFDDAELVD